MGKKERSKVMSQEGGKFLDGTERDIAQVQGRKKALGQGCGFRGHKTFVVNTKQIKAAQHEEGY